MRDLKPVLRTPVSCEDIWQQVSNYVDGDVSPDLRLAMDAHFAACRPCTAVLEGAKNLIQLVGHECACTMPADFSQRLHRKIQLEIEAEERLIAEQYSRKRVPLGIGEDEVNLGSHLLYFWENEHEFERGVGFLEPGLRAHDVCVIQGHAEAIEHSLNVLRSHGFNTRDLIATRRLYLVRREHAAQRTLLDFEAFLQASVNAGAPAIRILGNLGMGSDPLPGSEDDVIELEAKATDLIGRYPCVLICMYEIKTLTGRLVTKGGLQNHKHTVCSEGLHENSHYLPPEQVLKQLPHLQ